MPSPACPWWTKFGRSRTRGIGRAIAAANLPAEDPTAAEVVRTHTFATLTEAQARQVQGRHSRFLVELTSAPAEHEGQVLYDCAGPADLHRTVWLSGMAEGDELPELLTVEAVLVVIRHQERGGFPGFTELRLTGARVVR